MKISIDTRTLLSALNGLVKVVPLRSSSPILENILITADGNGVSLTASDLETTMTVVIPDDGGANAVREVGRAVIPARLLHEIVKQVTDDTVAVESPDGVHAAGIAWGSGRSSLPCFEAADYPDTSGGGGDAQTVSVHAPDLLSALNSTAFATCDNGLRPALSGILFEFTPDGSTVVATDAHRMACCDLDGVRTEKPAQFILPKRNVAVLKGILGSLGDVPVTLTFGATGAVFSAEGTSLRVRPVADAFPRWRSIIPERGTSELTIGRQDLASMLRRISVCANKETAFVKMSLKAEVTGGLVTAHAQDAGFGISATETAQAGYSGEDVTIGFKATYILEQLAAMTCGTVRMLIRGPRGAVLLSPAGDGADEDRSYAVIMPVMVA